MKIHNGKCPKCDQVMTFVNFQGVDAKEPFGNSWNAVSYQCPHCRTVLSVEIDPIALKADLVNELFKKLRAG
jgi:phage FluMu protein Com